MTHRLHAHRVGAVDLNIAAFDADITATRGQQDFFLGGHRHFAFASGQGDVFLGGDLGFPMLSLHLDLALGGDEFEADLVFHAIDEEADVLANVVQPSSAAGLVGVSLGDLVEVGASGETEVLSGECSDTCWC